MCVMLVSWTQRTRSEDGNCAHSCASWSRAPSSLLMQTSEPRPPAPAVGVAPLHVGLTSNVGTWSAAAMIRGDAMIRAESATIIRLLLRLRINNNAQNACRVAADPGPVLGR